MKNDPELKDVLRGKARRLWDQQIHGAADRQFLRPGEILLGDFSTGRGCSMSLVLKPRSNDVRLPSFVFQAHRVGPAGNRLPVATPIFLPLECLPQLATAIIDAMDAASADAAGELPAWVAARGRNP